MRTNRARPREPSASTQNPASRTTDRRLRLDVAQVSRRTPRRVHPRTRRPATSALTIQELPPSSVPAIPVPGAFSVMLPSEPKKAAPNEKTPPSLATSHCAAGTPLSPQS